LKPSRRGRVSESIAYRVLEERGYRVVDTRVRVRVGGVEVAEVDALAIGPDGALYAVEVKAGRLDVGGVRQAYSNAVLLNARPLVVCKGFADEAAEKLAERLGVRVIELSDLFLVDPEELATVVRAALAERLAELLSMLADPPRMSREDEQLLEAIADTCTIHDAAARLGSSVEAVARRLSELRRKGVLPATGSYRELRAVARLAVASARLHRRLCGTPTS